MTVKITRLAAENVKRVKAVTMEPTADGLTVIGGRNGQGKTSVLDAIAWALGGERNRPSNAAREGSALPPALRIELSNGLIVERKGKNSALKVTDPNGCKGGQALLDKFVEPLALNLPKFLAQTSAEKAKTLLEVIGVGPRLYELESYEKQSFTKRTNIGQMERQARAVAEAAEHYPDAPDELVSAADLIREQQDILARNGENQRKRDQLDRLRYDREIAVRNLEDTEDRVAYYTELRDKAKTAVAKLNEDIAAGEKSVAELVDESISEIEESIRNIDALNMKVRANMKRAAAYEEADRLKGEYDALTEYIEDVRAQKMALLNDADLPLEGLTVDDGELVYNGAKWDCMSGSEQLRVAAAIVRKLTPDCGFVLVDKLEQMDLDTLHEFGEWAEGEGLQIIATRVSTGEECSIVIEDGYGTLEAMDEEPESEAAQQPKAWKAGEF